MDTNYFEDELWKTETIENEALKVFHNIHVSINNTKATCLNFTGGSRSVPFSIDDKRSKRDNEISIFFNK